MLSCLQIVALREVVLMPGCVRKTQLVLTKEIVTDIFKLGA